MEVTGKRILYVITKSNWGGAQRYVYDLAVTAQEAGHSVLVAAGGSGELIERLKAKGIDVYSIPGLARDISLTHEWTAFRALLALFRKEHPQVVHLNSSKAGLAALAARIARVPHIIFTVHGWAWNEDRSSLQRALITSVYFVTLLLCHRVIVVSEAARRQGLRLPGVSQKMQVIHNGVHPVTFLSREEAQRALVSPSSCQIWIGTIAELHPVKGLPILIEAVEHLVRDEPDVQLVLIGEGQQRGQLEQQIKVEDMWGHTALTGHLPDAARYLPAFDIFVLPSRSEGLAYVLLEAGLARRAVVATAVGGIPEIIEHEQTGLLVPYGDRSALTEALRRLVKDEQLRRSLGEALHAKVANQFSLARMVRETLALY